MAAERIEVLTPSDTPPFPIEDRVDVDEALRLHYRYLDLRRPEMTRRCVLRHRVLAVHPPVLRRAGVRGCGDPHAHQEHARGGAGLPGPLAAAAGQGVRAPAVAAAVQAAADGGRARPLLPDRRAASGTRTSAPTGTGSSPSSTWRCPSPTEEDVFEVLESMFAALWRDVLEVELARAVPPAHVRGVDAPVRLRQARHAVRHGAGGPHRHVPARAGSGPSPGAVAERRHGQGVRRAGRGRLVPAGAGRRW